MATIEIKTAQKVKIKYELANYGDRFVANLLDITFLGVGTLILSGIIGWLSRYEFYDFGIYLISPLITCYSLYFEYFNNGQTPGKAIIKIRVVKLDGRRPKFGEYFIRWAFRLVDIWGSVASVATIMFLSSEKNQRLGDIIANTTLVKLVPKENMSLQAILNISNLDKYDPKYTQVTKLSEEDMLLVKKLLDRLNKNKNQAHLEALEQMATKIAEKLDIELSPVTTQIRNNPIMLQKHLLKYEHFLKILLKDYVVLTR